MMYATNILSLRPKVFVVSSAIIKKELGEAQVSATKKMPKRKLVLQSDSKQTTSEGSTAVPITLPLMKNPRTIKVKTPKKTSLLLISLQNHQSHPLLLWLY